MMFVDSEVHDIHHALKALGVERDALPESQYDQLDSQGYVVLPDVIDRVWLEELRIRLAELQEFEGRAAGHEVGGQDGADMLADLLNKGEVFEKMLREPHVLAAVHHVLGDFRVNSLNYRMPRLGKVSQQMLHQDCQHVLPDGRYRVCNSMWLMDDFTVENGATRVVPGTHLADVLPDEAMTPEQRVETHPDEVIVTGKAGSVIIFNSHTWHGRSANRTGERRGGMTLSFCQREIPQQLNQREYIRKVVYDRIGAAERYLMDVD